LTRTMRFGVSKRRSTLLLAFVIFSAGVATCAADSLYLAFVGTHTDQGSQGIYAFRFDPRSVSRNLAIDPTGRWLFAADHQSNNIQIFHVNPDTGKLTAVSQISGIFDPVRVIFAPIHPTHEAKGYFP
jgi:hypothetical protein